MQRTRLHELTDEQQSLKALRMNGPVRGSDVLFCAVSVVVVFILEKRRRVYRGVLRFCFADRGCKY